MVPVPALLHFLCVEISPVLLSYVATRSFLVKTALARERIHISDVWGFDVIENKDALPVEALGGMTFEDRVACTEAGAREAIWSFNPRFAYRQGKVLCFSPIHRWGVPNILGFLHLTGLLLFAAFIIYWCFTLAAAGIWNWADPRYLVYTWRLEQTQEYHIFVAMVAGFAVGITAYSLETIIWQSGLSGAAVFLSGTWGELVAMIQAARFLMRASPPSFNWQDDVFQQAVLKRSIFGLSMSNDDYGLKLEEALWDASVGKREKLLNLLMNPQLWSHMLYSSQEPLVGIPKAPVGGVEQLPLTNRLAEQLPLANRRAMVPSQREIVVGPPPHTQLLLQ